AAGGGGKRRGWARRAAGDSADLAHRIHARLRFVRAGPRIIDTSATLRLDASEQRSIKRNDAVGPTLGAYSDGEKESCRQDRRARTARTAVLGRDRDSTAQGVLGGRGRNRYQRARAASRAGEEHRPS